jgi:hypothetical protein
LYGTGRGVGPRGYLLEEEGEREMKKKKKKGKAKARKYRCSICKKRMYHLGQGAEGRKVPTCDDCRGIDGYACATVPVNGADLVAAIPAGHVFKRNTTVKVKISPDPLEGMNWLGWEI